uniref:NADH-ubiquinone oxidoreductase chain 5 n=2 Tax=unclassified Megaspilidae TaxID=1253067 RepID=A0A3S8V112_9HYME|nr:NADH dehydrogenase subunit 5 [Megaspilidae sp. SJW-2015]AZL93341.1 NADH dehydrogenase subunit 5 [Megaspilidae sp. ZJUH_2016022]
MKFYLFIYLFLVCSWSLFIMSVYLILLKLSLILSFSFYFESINFEFFVLVDWMSLIFISVVLLISSMVLLYSTEYVQGEIYIKAFFYLVLLFVFSMIMLIISPSIFSIILGWDGLGLVSYCLVSFYQNSNSFKSGLLTILMNRVGDVGLMILLVFMFLNELFFKYFYLITSSWLILFLVVSSMTKSAQIPFSIWLPAAMAAPTPVSALVHSSTLVTAGVYLLIRFNVLIHSVEVSELLLYFSLLTMIMSGGSAIFMYDLKKIIAMSTLSQLGLMFFFISLGFLNLSFFHLLTHALFKSLMFLCSGIIIHNFSNNQDIRFMGNLLMYLPFTGFLFFLSSLILVGFPFFSGFFSKDLMMEMLFMMNVNFLVFFFSCLALFSTVLYSFRLLMSLCLVNGKNLTYFVLSGGETMKFSLIPLMTQSVTFGAFMNSLLFMGNQIFLPILLKLLCLILIYLGIAFMYVSFSYYINFIKFKLLVTFMSSMWMMNFMVSFFVKICLKLSDEVVKTIDKGWSEQFIFSINLIFKLVMMYMFQHYKNKFNSYLVVIIYIMVAFILLA